MSGGGDSVIDLRSVRAVADKDFNDAIRSRLLLALTALFILFAAVAAYYAAEIQPPVQVRFGGKLTTFALIQRLVGWVAVFVPIVAIAASYRAIAGERQSGSLKLLLSLPNSREDVLLGKFFGRAGVVTFALLAGFTVGLVVVAVKAAAFSVLEYLAFVAVSLLLAFVFVSVAVGVSAFTSSTSRAAYGAFGVFIVFEFLWQALVTGVVYVLNGFSLPQRGELPGWLSDTVDVLFVVDPTTAYRQGVIWVVRRIADQAQQGPQGGGGGGPFYTQDWFGFVVLLVWIALPLAVGYLRFRDADL